MRTVEEKRQACAFCGEQVEFLSMDSPHQEAPTLIQPVGMSTFTDMLPWFGLVSGSDGKAELVIACSEACAQRLLVED